MLVAPYKPNDLSALFDGKIGDTLFIGLLEHSLRIVVI
jgi:hypothetical protein